MIVSVDSKSLDVPESRLFTYPTRMGNSWVPEILEIVSPCNRVESRNVTMHAEAGCTRDLAFKLQRNPKNSHYKSPPQKRLKRKLQAVLSRANRASKSLLDLSNEPGLLFDTRSTLFFTDGNIAHTLVNAAPILLELKAMGEDVTVIVREKPSSIAVKIYDQLGFRTIATSQDVIGNILVGESSRDDVNFWRMGCFGRRYETVEFEGYRTDTPKRIFISRSQRRCLTNEAEIESILEQRGFKKYYFESIPLSEQWSLAKNAEAVVAIHGAALSHMVFNRNSAKVIEMFHPGYHTKWFRTCLTAIGGQWCGVLGRFPADFFKQVDLKPNARRYALADLEVHPDSLRAALDYMGL